MPLLHHFVRQDRVARVCGAVGEGGGIQRLNRFVVLRTKGMDCMLGAEPGPSLLGDVTLKSVLATLARPT